MLNCEKANVLCTRGPGQRLPKAGQQSESKIQINVKKKKILKVQRISVAAETTAKKKETHPVSLEDRK